MDFVFEKNCFSKDNKGGKKSKAKQKAKNKQKKKKEKKKAT